MIVELQWRLLLIQYRPLFWCAASIQTEFSSQTKNENEFCEI